MLTPAQLVALPYDSQFSRAGASYAQLSLHYTYNRMGLDLPTRLRKIASGIACEMAFRRWLESQHIPYDRLGATDFKERDRYDIGIGGRRCDLKSFLIDNPKHQAQVLANPAWLLDCSALVPIDQFVSQSLGERDIYLFGFVVGHEAHNSEQTRDLWRQHQALHLLYPLTAPAWYKPTHWKPIFPLVLKSNLAEPIDITLGGLDEHHRPLYETLTLQPRQRTTTSQPFYALLYVQVNRPPEAAIGIYSQPLDDLLLVASYAWQNIWLYGQCIYLAGWLAKQEFRAKSQQLLAGSSVKQYRNTKTHNRAMLIQDLRPMSQLVRLYAQPPR